MSEFSLRIPVANWLLSRGLAPVLECASMRRCDMIGVRFDGPALVEMVAVELKLSDVGGVIAQCSNHFERVTEVWAALPIKVAKRAAERFQFCGIGLIGVDGQTCSVLSSATRFDGRDFTRFRRAMHQRRNEYIWRMKHPLMLRFPAEAIVRAENQAAADAAEAT